jgi:DNA protecting protein DprA
MADTSQPSLFADPVASRQVPFPIALLALASVKGLSLKGLRALLAALGDDLGRLLTGDDDFVRAALGEAKVPAADKVAHAILADRDKLVERSTAEVEILERRGVQVIPPSRLPVRFREGLADAPPWVFVEGDPCVLDHRPMVAVVGTRNPTEKGLRAAEVVAKVLAPYPIVLVSGLAEGIDATAHAVSLDQGVRNLAFLGHGINTVYPESTAQLRRLIVRQGGAVASEYFPAEGVQRRYFVERNRLQAALADIIIPVEGEPEGGTAHTVRFARQMGRRLVGVRWPQATGIVEQLGREDDTVVDIFTAPGCRELDRLFQQLVEQHRQEAPYPLAQVEQNLLRESRFRAVRPEHLRRLMGTIEKAAKEMEDGGAAQSSDLRPLDPPGADPGCNGRAS